MKNSFFPGLNRYFLEIFKLKISAMYLFGSYKGENKMNFSPKGVIKAIFSKKGFEYGSLFVAIMSLVFAKTLITGGNTILLLVLSLPVLYWLGMAIKGVKDDWFGWIMFLVIVVLTVIFYKFNLVTHILELIIFGWAYPNWQKETHAEFD
jgi:hypothetical protein